MPINLTMLSDFSIPWADFPAECLWYVFPYMGILHFAVFMIGCLVLLICSRGRWAALRRRISRFGLFMFLLLFFGAIFNGLWSCSVYGRLYYTEDDLVFHFFPFLPITQAAIDSPNEENASEHGKLLGVSLLQLQCIWLVFAAGTWTTTIVSYRIIRRGPPLIGVAEIKQA